MQRTTCRGALALVAVLMLVGLAGCGDDNETSAGSGQATTTAGPATTRAAVVTTAAAPLLKVAQNERFGTIVVDTAGKALYTWDRDTGPVSTCTGNCAVTWPPLLLPAGGGTPIPNTGVTGKLGASPRPDGGSQVTWNDKPLYRYAGDANPGDVTGDGVGGTWHIAVQAGA